MPSRKDSFSDRELKALLQGLRDDLAAPADFRARVMQRLQAEGLVAPPARPQPAGWRERVAALFSPKLGLGAGALAALALAYVAISTAPEEARVAPLAPATVASSPAPKAQPKAVLARAPKAVQASAAPVLAKAPAPMRQADVQGQGPAPAMQGRSDAQPAASSVQVASAKPTVVVVETPIVAHGKPLQPGSEVRNNVVHASRGEAALIFMDLLEAGHVRVEVFDRLGHSVSVLYDGELNAGPNSLRWSGAADKGGMAASGIYMVRITGPGLDGRHKVLLAR
jgi:hypothetical protein